MRDNADQWNETRRSLISRLRNWEDHASWQEFFDTYWKLIYTVSRKSGLTDSEAEEVVQETVLSIAKKMPTFHYDPARCSFKGWLKHVTRLRIIDQYRKRQPELRPLLSPDADSNATAVEPQVPDPRGSELEAVWDQEWETNLFNAAMERVKAKTKAEAFQIFYMHLVQHIPAREVARMLGINLAKVYLVSRRITKRVKDERQRLEKTGMVQNAKRL